ncbi:MAG: ABC transporter ATP-binding protein [Planctomycetota bacterium]
MNALLDVQNVSRHFGGVRALHEVSLKVMEGVITGLIGPNGAGKTTLFNLMSGVDRPTTGRILLAGKDLHGLKPHQVCGRGMARTFQNIRLFGKMSVMDNVQVGRHLRGGDSTDGEALRRLEMVGLSGHEEEMASSLPYGLQRRLEIARALATDPRILLLDEPAAGLNPTETDDMTRLIRSIAKTGVTVVLIEHDMRLVMGLCDRIAVLDHGETIAEGTPVEIRLDPRVREAYLGEGSHA